MKHPGADVSIGDFLSALSLSPVSQKNAIPAGGLRPLQARVPLLQHCDINRS
jgi:hypothetical protein